MGGELVSLVAVDGRAAGPNLNGLSDLATECVVLSGYHFNIVFSNRMFMLTHCCTWGGQLQMFFNPSLQGAASFPHIFLRALGALYFVYHATFLGIVCFVFGVDQDRAEGVERLVASFSEVPLT